MSDPSAPGLTTFRVDLEQLRDRGVGAWLGPAPYVLEIGFGRGDLLLALGAANPGVTYLGVEVSHKRVDKVDRRAQRLGVSNVRLLQGPAEYVLGCVISDASIDECWINCPDPWPKKRHHRRRFFQAESIAQLARVLRPGALLHASTDHVEYAEWIRTELLASPLFESLWPEGFTRTPPERPRTAYEQEWLAEGRTLAYFDYRRHAVLQAPVERLSSWAQLAGVVRRLPPEVLAADEAQGDPESRASAARSEA